MHKPPRKRRWQRSVSAARLGFFGGKRDDGVPRIAADELAEKLRGEYPPIVLDVRTRSQYKRDNGRIPGSIRVLPNRVEDWASRWLASRPADPPRAVVTYCTCPSEATSIRAAGNLKEIGFEAAALMGGFEAWKAKYLVELTKAEEVTT
jgi:rhodanese-related sulfurtransferase